MNHLRLLISFLFVLGMSAVPGVRAQDAFSIPGLDGGFGLSAGQEETKGELKALTDGYKRGETFSLLLSLNHPAGWHSYYLNPGSVGLPPQISLKAPEGFDVKGPFWSIPHIGKVANDLYYGGSAPQFLWLVTPTDKAAGEATFTATGSWQLCGDEGCLEPTPETSYTVKLSPTESPLETAASDIPLPQTDSPFAKDWKISATKETTPGKAPLYQLHLAFPQGEKAQLEKVYFFSDTGEVLPTETQKLVPAQDGYTLDLPFNDEKNSFYPVIKKTDRLTGILTFRLHGEEKGILLDLPLNTATAVTAGKPADASSPSAEPQNDLQKQSLFQIIIGLFLGGLILNLMPCVFPVIGLKIMSFVQMGGGERSKVIFHSLSFVIGVLISFWIITTLLAVLKMSIPDINWAFWLENPWVIYLLLLLMIGMGLSMFGVFEIGVGATGIGGTAQMKKGYSGSFYSGVLATVVATPCSAPFLGASLGPAMSLSTPMMYVAFTFMGLGMALPYLILGAFPGLTRFLPKPGAWMESFKQGLSFLLFATAAWLLWTYWAFFPESDPLAPLTMLFGLVLFAFIGWIKGRWDLPYKSTRTRWTARILMILLGLGALYMSCPRSGEETVAEADFGSPSASDSSSLNWEKWSPALQEQALKEGRPVYIDFTARWCATCQVNKSVAYTESVRKIFRENNVLLLKADKTTSNPVIDAELKKLGRTAVPVNVLYIPGDATPYITQPILSGPYLEEFLLEHLRK